jgi:hypothetical protein
VTARSRFDRAATEALAAVFVPTTAYDRALEVLVRHCFTVLTGPPEMGKTAIARTLALALMTDAWEVHECTRPEQLFTALNPARRQVFVADDAFGSTEYRPDAAERWAREMERILRTLDDRHWLIWTSRPAPLRAGLDRIHRERGAERFPAPGEVLVDAGRLSAEEKTLILFRHAKAAELAADVCDALPHEGSAIVGHRHFTPERIRRLVARLATPVAEAEPISILADLALSQASEAMITSFTALAADHRDLLIAMLDTPLGPVGERELGVAVRRHHPGGLPRAPAELVDRLTDHFLRVEEHRISWVHPSWRDLVIEQLRADGGARQRFLQCCSVHGVLLALSVAGGSGGERTLPLLVTDADWDALGDRVHGLIPELEPGELIAVLDAVREAYGARLDAVRQELAALAWAVLARSRSPWQDDRRAIPLPELEAWFALGRVFPDRPPAPSLGTTWVELLPARAPAIDDREAVERMIDWLVLVEVIRGFDPALLRALGSADALEQQLDSGIWSLDAELGARALMRILRVFPADAQRVERLRAWLQGPGPPVRPEREDPRWDWAVSTEWRDLYRVLRDL